MSDVDYDPEKRAAVLAARDLDMERAGQAFDGPHVTIPDIRQDYGEDRFVTIGHLDSRMVVLVWTWREDRMRIISMRKANDREQARYRPRLG